MDTIFESFLPQEEFGVESTSVAPAILSQPDFNGDGIVNYKDVLIVNFKVLQGRVTGRYDAIFDRNSDGKVDALDVRATLSSIGNKSSELDLQLVEIYKDTKSFYSNFGILSAILNGYTAFTPAFQGHGEHWVNVSRIAEVLTKPKAELTHTDYIGINVEPLGGGLLERKVLGVFYLIQPDNLTELWNNFVSTAQDGDEEINFGIPEYQEIPDIFADDPLFSPHVENWHQHNSVYIHYPNPLDPTSVIFEQNLSPEELYQRYKAATIDDPSNELVVWGIETGNGFDFNDISQANVMFLPSFQMMHGWVNALNPGEFGVFGETNPLVSPDAPPLPSAHGHSQHMMVV